MIDLSDTRHRLRDLRAVSQRTNLPLWRLYAEAEAGRLPTRQVGRRLFCTDADIDTYLDRIRRGDAR